MKTTIPITSGQQISAVPVRFTKEPSILYFDSDQTVPAVIDSLEVALYKGPVPPQTISDVQPGGVNLVKNYSLEGRLGGRVFDMREFNEQEKSIKSASFIVIYSPTGSLPASSAISIIL